MKKVTTIGILVLAFSASYYMASAQQWTGSSTTSGDINRSGRVGIGTTSPSSPLDITYGSYDLLIAIPNFNITAKPHLTLTQQSTSAFSDEYARMTFENISNSHQWLLAGKTDASDNEALFKFQYLGNTHPTIMTLRGDGAIGMGTTNPLAKLHIVDGDIGKLMIAPDHGSNYHSEIFMAEDNDGTYGMALRYNGVDNKLYISGKSGTNTYGPHLTIQRNNGNVGIGTTDPQGYKLAVAGNMIAEGVRIKLESQWPDYVFENSYELKSLEEVASFIRENKHLPGIPSAIEVKEQGIDMAQMDARLLEKIEELTLHMIEQHRTIRSLEAKLKALQQ